MYAPGRDAMARSTFIGMVLLVAVAVATPAQTLSGIDDQSDVSQILNAHGTLYVLETHPLQSLSVLGPKNIKCTIVVVRVLSGSELSEHDTITVGLELVAEEDRIERKGRLDAREAQALMAYLELIMDKGRSILDRPTVDTDDTWQAEIHYSTKEKVKLAAFIDRGGALKFGLKVGPRADWMILSSTGVRTLSDNLQRTIDSDVSG